MSTKMNLVLLFSALVSTDAFALHRMEDILTPEGYSCEEYTQGYKPGTAYKVRLCTPASPTPRYNTPSSLYEVLGLRQPMRNYALDADAYLPLQPNEEQLQALDWQQPLSALKTNQDDSVMFKRYTQIPSLPFAMQSSQKLQNLESNVIEPNEVDTNSIGWRDPVTQAEVAFARRLNKIGDDVSTIKESLTDLTAFVKNYVSSLEEKHLSAVTSQRNDDYAERRKNMFSGHYTPVTEPKTADLSTQLLNAFMQELLTPDTSNHELPSTEEHTAQDLEDTLQKNENMNSKKNDYGMAKISIITRIGFDEDSNEGGEDDDNERWLGHRWHFNAHNDEQIGEHDITSTSEKSSDESTSDEDTTAHEESNASVASTNYDYAELEDVLSSTDEHDTHTDSTNVKATSNEDIPKVKIASAEKISSENFEENLNAEIDYYDDALQAFLRTDLILRTKAKSVEEASDTEQVVDETTRVEAVSSSESNENASDKDSGSNENGSEEENSDSSEVYGMPRSTEGYRKYNDDFTDNLPHYYYGRRTTEMPTMNSYEGVENAEESEEHSSEDMLAADSNEAEELLKEASSEENESVNPGSSELSNEDNSEGKSPADDSNEKFNVDCDISQYTNGREFDPLREMLIKRLVCPSENTEEMPENMSENASEEVESAVDSMEASTESNWSYEEW